MKPSTIARYEAMKGHRFGRLTFTGNGRSQTGRAPKVECRCACGSLRWYEMFNLQSGRTTRCMDCRYKPGRRKPTKGAVKK